MPSTALGMKDIAQADPPSHTVLVVQLAPHFPMTAIFKGSPWSEVLLHLRIHLFFFFHSSTYPLLWHIEIDSSFFTIINNASVNIP